MRMVSAKMPELYVRGIDELVKAGRYTSRSEVIRAAVRDLLRRELWSDCSGSEAVEAPGTDAIRDDDVMFEVVFDD